MMIKVAKRKVKKVPLVYINGEKVKNPYKYKEYQRILDKRHRKIIYSCNN